MKSNLLLLPESVRPDMYSGSAVCIGKVVEITKDFRIKIDYPGNVLGPIQARTIIRTLDIDNLNNAQVMLCFENDEPDLPIVVGIVSDSIKPNQTIDANPLLKSNRASIDMQDITLKATKTITLQCGDSSISLHKDGKIIIRGKKIISRASKTNSIKGAKVNIN